MEGLALDGIVLRADDCPHRVGVARRLDVSLGLLYFNNFGVYLGHARRAFSPRQDRRHSSLASVRRRIVDRMRGAAIRELIAQGLIDQFCPMRKQQKQYEY